jgi:hypothetical protein
MILLVLEFINGASIDLFMCVYQIDPHYGADRGGNNLSFQAPLNDPVTLEYMMQHLEFHLIVAVTVTRSSNSLMNITSPLIMLFNSFIFHRLACRPFF